jgi:manganese efflux pump family protein
MNGVRLRKLGGEAMNVLSLFLVAIGLSVDAFTISFTGGILTKKQKIKNALKIGIYFSVIQTSVAAFGWFLGVNTKNLLAEFGQVVSIGLLALIGVRMIFQYIKELKEEETKELSPKFFPLLALLVSFDELAAGISFGLSEVNIIETLVVLAITFFITSFIGILLGRKIGLVLKKKADLIGGIMFLVISALSIFDF